MFVYIWKHNDTPFYVGMSNARRRTDPLAANPRGWFCKQKLAEIGAKNVVVEVHTRDGLEEAKLLERSLIEKYGRIQLETGTLTNLRMGGEGRTGMPEAEKAALRKRMKENNPTKNPETRAKITARMNEPQMKAKFVGDNNPAKRPEVREKLLAKWQDPEYRARQILARIGLTRHSTEFKEAARQRLLDPTNPMREQHKILNTDLTVRAKRNAAIRSPEVRAKHKANADKRWADPAARAALAEKMRAIWAIRKASITKP